VQGEAAWLHVLRPEQAAELAAVADDAQRAETGSPEWRSELAYWTRDTRAEGAGTSSDLPISATRDRAALFAILYGRSDEPRDWLHAGEALSAGWLTATERGISVLPLSAPVEVISTRDTMRRHLSYLNHPFLVLRLGTVDQADADATHAPRLPRDQTINRL
jgi:hypothetical protein